MPHLLTRQTKGTKLLIDYSHIVTSIKYLEILYKKMIDRIIMEEITKANKKDNERKRTRKSTYYLIVEE